MALVGFMEAERLVCQQLLAHGKNGRKKGEPDRWISFVRVWCLFPYAMTTPSGSSSGGIFLSVLRRPVIVCAVNWH
jgi:hypothetical protein